MGRLKNETREEYNVRYRLIMKKVYETRKSEALTYLGSKCVDCGYAECLEFDHVNPELKSFNISQKLNSAPWQTILTELDKCVLRCLACHAHKTSYDRLQKINLLTMGP